MLDVRCPATVILSFISLTQGLLLDLEPDSQRHVQLILLLLFPRGAGVIRSYANIRGFYMGARKSNLGPHAYTA